MYLTEKNYLYQRRRTSGVQRQCPYYGQRTIVSSDEGITILAARSTLDDLLYTLKSDVHIPIDRLKFACEFERLSAMGFSVLTTSHSRITFVHDAGVELHGDWSMEDLIQKSRGVATAAGSRCARAVCRCRVFRHAVPWLCRKIRNSMKSKELTFVK